MRIAIFGASGKAGIEVVKQALEKHHKVTAIVRNPDKLLLKHDLLTIVSGDVFNKPSVRDAVEGQDAVICCLGSGTDLGKTNVRSTGTSNIISAMQKNKVKRLIAISAMGVAQSWNDLSRFNKFIFAVLMKSTRVDHEAQEIAIKQSGLDWTIIRPSGLTDMAKTGIYEVGERIRAETSKISRADVADLILKELEQKKMVGKAVTITN